MEANFRLCAKNFILTYPNCPEEWLSTQYLKDYFENKLGPIEKYVYAKEYHEDGTPHYHVYLGLESKLDVRNPRYFDIVESRLGQVKHGNYKCAKPKQQKINYCMKGNDYISNCQKVLTKEEKNKEILSMARENGVTYLLEQGIVSLKEYVWVNNGWNLYQSQNQVDNREDLGTRLENTWNLTLTINLDLKKCHYWIWSKMPNRGKTTWILSLMKKYRAAIWSTLETFQSQISQNTEVICLDEFRKGSMKISMMNSLCDGTLAIPRKGLPSITLNNKPLVIVTGNCSPMEVYPQSFSYIEARFNIIELE